MSPCKPKLTKFSPRVGRRKRHLRHAPVEDVAVAVIWVEDRCEVPEMNSRGWRAASFAWAEGSPKGAARSADEGSGALLPALHTL